MIKIQNQSEEIDVIPNRQTLEELETLKHIFDTNACVICNSHPAIHANNSLCLVCWANAEGDNPEVTND